MENVFAPIDLVIFDLDGTLYEDTDHFDYYAEQLLKELPEDKHADFLAEYKKMVAGDHTVSIGKVYDVVRDYILQLDSASLTVNKAWTWEGEEVGAEEINRLYPHPIAMDFDTMIAIGDGWWLPNVCAKHFGAANTQSAYGKTKDFMATEAFTLTKIPGLREALYHLKSKKDIILVTNSEKDDVGRLLHQLDLENIFDEIVTEARKPQHTKTHFSNLLEKYDCKPEKAISIGDNFINEIAPAIALGMRTVFIDLYEMNYPEYQGKKVKSISNLIQDMVAL
ncbi:HAD family hydrolase [Caldibacillus lycopersici]|uniref:HAD family hydrolase n=1 Tax=Perspicuibacillus lycopersici TaxID=1325689 RepID=A0AAE3IS55_9BACI|nr:HAD family hydrolase [Perspicuibacillus lycopersici]MCU9613417.1 HAD family hydrolase [Perspicuibacillus lycopersici]